MTLAWKTKTTECGRDTYCCVLCILLQRLIAFCIAAVNPAYLFQEDFNTNSSDSQPLERSTVLVLRLPSPGKLSPGVNDFWWKGRMIGFQTQWAFISMYSLSIDLAWMVQSYLCDFPFSVFVHCFSLKTSQLLHWLSDLHMWMFILSSVALWSHLGLWAVGWGVLVSFLIKKKGGKALNERGEDGLLLQKISKLCLHGCKVTKVQIMHF